MKVVEDITTIYYVAISGLQKCVRRGDFEGASRMWRVASRIKAKEAHARLYTILFEDCGRDYRCLQFFHNWRGSLKSTDDGLRLVKALCESTKSRDAHAASKFITGKAPITSYVRSTINFSKYWANLGWVQASWNSQGFDVYNKFKFVPEKQWVVDFCINTSKYDRSSMSASIPMFHAIDCTEVYQQVPEECGLNEYYEGIPLEALDKHTRPGLTVLGEVYNELRSELIGIGITSYCFGMYVFMNEGRLLTNKVLGEIDFWALCSKVKAWDCFEISNRVTYFKDVVQLKLNTSRVDYLNDFSDGLLEGMLRRMNT